MTRQEINREILKILSDLNEGMPQIRFGQLLAIAKIITYKNGDIIKGDPPEAIADIFNEESKITLNRMKSNK